MIEAFPLTWPLGYKRTKDFNRKGSPFKQTPEKAQKYLHDELSKLGAKKTIVSTNVPVRKDGYFYSDMAMTNIPDPGVSVYFDYKGKDISMCADQYSTVTGNLYAIARSINAIRSMERWGVSDFMERTFAGFKAIPAEVQFNCWDVLDMKPSTNKELIKMQYKARVFAAHPDHGGSSEKFHQVQSAFEQAIKYADNPGT